MDFDNRKMVYMKKLILLLPAAMLLLFSCHYMGGKRVRGNGVVSKEQRSVTGFTGVETHGSIDIMVSQGPFKIEVEADQNILPYIETEVENGRLKVRFKNDIWLQHYDEARVYVTAPDLRDFEIHGSGNINSQGQIKDNMGMTTRISGSGDITLEINTPKINTETHGSGNTMLRGETRDLSSLISGSGNVRAGDLKAENVKVSVHGSGDTDVFASSSLDVTVSGSGDIRYKGNPTMSTEIHGSGSVKKID
jgi:hypothetical protein